MRAFAKWRMQDVLPNPIENPPITDQSIKTPRKKKLLICRYLDPEFFKKQDAKLRDGRRIARMHPKCK